MKVQTIQRSSTAEMIIEAIVRNIKTGELKPGDRLPPERTLIQMFGVGRSSVREAIKGLVLLGYLESTQGRGTFVKKAFPYNDVSVAGLRDVLAAESIVELMELRQILECNAVRLAALRAEGDDIQRIREALARMKASQDDIKLFYTPDFDFHISIAEATHNKMICDMMKLIVEKSHEFYDEFMPERLCPPEQAIDSAEEIVTHIVDGNAKAAAISMQKHLGLVENELKRVVPKLKEAFPSQT